MSATASVYSVSPFDGGGDLDGNGFAGVIAGGGPGGGPLVRAFSGEALPRVRRARDRGELAGQVRAYLRVVQQRRHLARRFFRAEPVRYAA